MLLIATALRELYFCEIGLSLIIDLRLKESLTNRKKNWLKNKEIDMERIVSLFEFESICF
jgi:hypothetical protein